MKKPQKMLGAAAVAAALAMTLSGCIGSAASTETAAAPEGKAGGEVRVLINSGGNAKWLEAAIPKFEQANPGFDVVLDVQEAAAIRDRSVQLYASSDAPDLAMGQWVTQQYQTLLKAGALSDVTDVWKNSGLAENNTKQVMAGWTKDDAQYGLPLTKTWTPVIFYNKALFKEAGIDAPEGAPTAEEWNDIISKLKAKGLQPLAVGAGTGQAGAMHFLLARTQVHASATEWAEFTKPTVDAEVVKSDAFRAAMDDLVTWNKSGVFANGSATAQEAQAVSLFTAGGAAMLSIGVWGDGIIDSQKVPFETGWMLYPSAEEEAKFLTVNTGGLVIPKSARNVAGAKKFAEYLASAEGQALLASSSSQVPTRTDVDAGALAGALLPNTNEMREAFTTIGEVSPWVDSRLSPALMDGLSKVMVGELTADQFIDELHAKLSK